VFCYKQGSLYKFNTWHPLTLCFLTFMIINNFCNCVYVELVTVIVAPLFWFLAVFGLSSGSTCYSFHFMICLLLFRSLLIYLWSYFRRSVRIICPHQRYLTVTGCLVTSKLPWRRGRWRNITSYPHCSLRWGYTSWSKSHTNKGSSCVREMSCNQNIITPAPYKRTHAHTHMHSGEVNLEDNIL
jgi:hypothetical protein